MLLSTLQLSHHKTTVTDCFIYSLIISRHPRSDLAAAYRSGFLPGSQFSSIMQKKKSKINKVVTQTCRVSQMFWKKLRGTGPYNPGNALKILYFSLFIPHPVMFTSSSLSITSFSKVFPTSQNLLNCPSQSTRFDKAKL